MSFAELKEQVAGLSVEDLFKLSAFVAELEEEKEEAFRAEVARRMKAMDSGARMTMEEFETKSDGMSR